MTISHNERGSALLLLIGLLMLAVSVVFIGINAVHYFLTQQALQAALDRTLMISVNSYDMSQFMNSGDFLDIRLDENLIRKEFPSILASEFPDSTVKLLNISRDEISARVVFRWSAPLSVGELGRREIMVRATIRAQIAQSPA